MKIKFMAALIAVATIVAVSTPSDARPRHYKHHTQKNYRIAQSPKAVRLGPQIDIAALPAYSTEKTTVAPRQTFPMGRKHIAPSNGWNLAEGVIGGRPSGCPSRYCGCSASLRVFGRIIPGLNLAANWRQFPSALPGPGMAAWRYGHVFVIESVNSDGSVVAHDGNSGRGLTRIHTVSLRGYRVVNPSGGVATFSARKIRLANR